MVTCMAAEGEAVGMDEPAAGEHRDGGGAGAHVDHGGAEIGLVVGQRREPGHIGLATIASTSRWQRSTASIRLRGGRHVGGHDMHVDAELRASMPRGSRMPPASSTT